MRDVAVIGIGKTAFGAFADRDLKSLAVEAGEQCFRDSSVWPSQVESFFLGNFAGPSFTGQNHLAPYVSTALGMTGIPATRVADQEPWSRRFAPRHSRDAMGQPSGYWGKYD